ncbi:MAG: hypothetical protein US76_01600 [Parcubacteria group bacterium GW2011_GWA2_38_13b]|nr:MAG: hypothetical protein US76_01600 [Parcubacteria group bacterium GW2011_GWA2_38_13b]
MDLKNIETVGVVGAGTMGSGIAQVFAEAGFTVYLIDETYEKATEGKRKIVERLQKSLKKQCNENENISSSAINNMNSILLNITPLKLEDLIFVQKPQLFIEAVFEDLKTKQTVFRELDRLCGPDTILTTNTSSISIWDISKAVTNTRKSKIIGMHFMNPPYILKLLEIIKSDRTSDETYSIVQGLAKRLNREPILTSMDRPGFLCNRILMPSILEALRTLEENVGNVEDIDLSVKTGVAGAMDILKLGDLIGWDVVLNIVGVLHEAHGSRYEPPHILRNLVRDGFLGRKVKKGIFDFYRKEK